MARRPARLKPLSGHIGTTIITTGDITTTDTTITIIGTIIGPMDTGTITTTIIGHDTTTITTADIFTGIITGGEPPMTHRMRVHYIV